MLNRTGVKIRVLSLTVPARICSLEAVVAVVSPDRALALLQGDSGGGGAMDQAARKQLAAARCDAQALFHLS